MAYVISDMVIEIAELSLMLEELLMIQLEEPDNDGIFDAVREIHEQLSPLVKRQREIEKQKQTPGNFKLQLVR